MAKRKTTSKQNRKIEAIVSTIIAIGLFISGVYLNNEAPHQAQKVATVSNYGTIIDVPEYTDSIYVELNNNIPDFTQEDYTTDSFEIYGELDEKGRCGVAYANICKDIMPQEGEKRGDISNVKPTGWVQKKYDGEYLYNRCHLIGYQLANENDNKRNLITGTRYFNVSGMLPFENQVAEYVRKAKQDVHVLYRVTPIYKEDNLLASGVEIEAYSVEDKGQGICFHVYVYNVQPGIEINYKTGESSKKGE